MYIILWGENCSAQHKMTGVTRGGITFVYSQNIRLVGSVLVGLFKHC